MNPREEAQALLPSTHVARVLEPSPPAVDEGPYFADDPAVVGQVAPGLTVVTPTTAGDVTWDEMSRQDQNIADYAADHWLGNWRRLPDLPPGYVDSVVALNQVAFYALAPARFASNGKLGLRYTHGGFGTPFYSHDRQVRVEGAMLVVIEDGLVRTEPVSTLRQAASFAGVEYRERWGPEWHDQPKPFDPDSTLQLDPAAVEVASAVIGLAYSVLEQLRCEADESDRPSRVQLWPEHFDVAVEIGDETSGRRSAFGVSPGYAAHPEPFVYVSPWDKSRLTDRYWNADFFQGSIMDFEELRAAEDQRGATLRFLRTGLSLMRTL
ncbi:MAG: hypothetical protein ACT4OP_09325 [Actinomycetota bacterium]